MRDHTKKLSPSFIDEIVTALNSLRFGSVEIYVQDGVVTQLTVRNIKKTKVDIARELKTSKTK